MKFTLAASVFLLGLANALPAEDSGKPSNNPINFDGPGLSTTIKCGHNTYTGHDVYLAAQHAVNLGLMKPPQTRGRKEYPHEHVHDDSKGVKIHFPAHCPQHDPKRKSYPLKAGKPYDGGKNNIKPGAERVVFYYDGTSVGADGHPLVHYCGLLTHTGAKEEKGFLKCEDGK